MSPSDPAALLAVSRAEYLAASIAGDARRAQGAAEAVLRSGRPLRVVHEQVIRPALVEVGALWERGELRTADEHLASTVTQAVLARIAPPVPQGARRQAILACPAGEHHHLGARIVADRLQADGWNVAFLGPSTPGDELAAVAAERGASLVGISCTMRDSLDSAILAAEEIARVCPETRVVLGGQGAAAPAQRGLSAAAPRA